MSMTWLADTDKDTAWAHHAWSAFADLPGKGRVLAVLPVFGFADHGLGLPLDVEEAIGGVLLKTAVVHSKHAIGYRVLPPLRFALAPYGSTFFGVDAETAHDLIREIAEAVKAAGFAKLVFFVTSPWHEEFIDAASRDTRVALGLQTFVINLSGLGLDFHPASDSRGALQSLGVHVLNTLPDPARAADIADADFRPGHYRQPAPVAAVTSLAEAHRSGADTLAAAGAHLARLFAEIDARAPLTEARSATRDVPISPAPPTTTGRPTPPAGNAPPPIAPPTAPSPAAPWPGHRRWYLPALTRDALEALPDKARALVIIPTGAIEQHGHHLPVGVDAILGQAWLDATLPKLPAGTPVYVAPPITFGKSNEHIGFPGTVFISAKSLRRLLLALAAQLQALGFRQIAVLNTHGGNSAVLVYTLREIQTLLGLRAGMLSFGYKPPLSPQEAEYGFHGGEWETSLMLAATEGLVDMGKAVCEFPARIDDPGELRPENAPAIFSWISRDLSRSGVMGDATAASLEKGRRWLDEASSALALRITALLSGH